MTAGAWVLVGIGSWLTASLPASMLFVRFGEPCGRVPGEDLPVIADEDRCPARPPVPEALLHR